MSKSEPKPTTTWEIITPDIASTLLESMAGNRPVAQRRVERMAADIKAGKWAENGESIIIDDDGRLLDGQHRCWAVVEASKAIRTVVVRGVHPAMFVSIDQGRYRTDADILSIADGSTKTPKLLAAALRLLMWWEGGYSHAAFRALDGDKGRLLAIHGRHPRMIESMEFCGGARFRQLLRPSVAAFAHYVGRKFGSECDPDEFWMSVSTGAGLDRGDPALALREYLRRRHGDVNAANRIGGARFTSYLEAEVCLRAWNAHCEGASLAHVQVGEQIPEPYGSPKYDRRTHMSGKKLTETRRAASGSATR